MDDQAAFDKFKLCAVEVLQVDPDKVTPLKSEFELSRYLEYCSEMLALISKLAAIYASRTQDREITAAVNEIEELTGNLGRKIWQKTMIATRLNEQHAPHAAASLDP